MEIVKIESTTLKVLYSNIGNTFGFYAASPGEEPFICLSEKLPKKGVEIQMKVFQAFLELHNSIPLDSWQRLFPIIKYFEELKEAETYNPEVIVFNKICGVMAFSKISQPKLGMRFIGKEGARKAMSAEDFPGKPLPGGELEMLGPFGFKVSVPTMDERIARALDEPTYEKLEDVSDVDPWEYSATDEVYGDDIEYFEEEN